MPDSAGRNHTVILIRESAVELNGPFVRGRGRRDVCAVLLVMT